MPNFFLSPPDGTSEMASFVVSAFALPRNSCAPVKLAVLAGSALPVKL